MEYIKLDGINNEISRIAFGCAIEPMLAGENVHELLDACVDMGITTFDTAENYGLSEVSLGNWMRDRKNRDKLVIISKGCHPYDGKDRVNPEELIKDIEDSFKRLGTDYIDIYFMHRDDLKIEVGPMVEILNEYHKKGKIGAFGGSNWTHERIEEANMYAKEHGFTRISSVLGISRFKDFDQVCRVGKQVESEYRIPYDTTNWRKNGGLEKAERLAKEFNLYRQTYCGCKPK